VEIELLFHSDLGRIGERHRAGWADDAGPRAPIVVGREGPFFQGETGPAQPLLDPCLSRHQALVSWLPDRQRFHVDGVRDARRPLRLLDAGGHDLGPPPREVEPGALLAIGDRVLLRLAIRAEQGEAGGDDLGMIGHSETMQALRQRICTLADFQDTALICGETGTGKELVAQAIHRASQRRGGPFVALNCGALPESLIESELFGYVKGAFSGATHGKPGVFAAAQGGTLFLDEIGELPLPVQAKLLRVLEVRRVRPVGGQNEEPIDVRVVAATHRDLEVEAAQGRFRPDLFGRLERPRLDVPPLRERREDIPLLLARFLRRRADDYARTVGKPLAATPLAALWSPPTAYAPPIPLDYLLRLLDHDWPRNVRELDKFSSEMAAAVVQSRELPTPPGSPGASPRPGEVQPRLRSRPSRADLERSLEVSGFNQTEAARALGVPYATLDRWLRESGILRPADLTRDDLLKAQQESGGDMEAAARQLRVSARGLRTRARELGLDW
jgi:DNA-binding NtrC family response regulator